MRFLENILLAPYTVFKIGGPARCFCEVKNKDELMTALKFAEEKSLPFFVLGAGSNVLVSDAGFAGLVIKMNLQGLNFEDNKLKAEAGVNMARAVNFAAENNLGGFEWGIGIPGTIGGSVFGNAGCHGGDMSQAVESVEIFDGKSAQTLQNSECEFGYRDSVFKKNPNWIILSATLKLDPGNTQTSRAKILEYTKKRATAQDIGSKCAGCIFKNPKPDLAAGFLIDTAGLKGKSIGTAMVSQKHANYIVNTGGAAAHDVRALIDLIKTEVQKKHGILLEEEISMI